MPLTNSKQLRFALINKGEKNNEDKKLKQEVGFKQEDRR